jgi:hypothetical protein
MTAPLTDLPDVGSDLDQFTRAGSEGQQMMPADRRRRGLTAAWRTWRGPLALLVLISIGVAFVVVLAPTPRSNTYLDPASSDATGSKALADILAERGFRVTGVYSPTDALAAVGTARPGPRRQVVTLVITSPSLLTATQERQLAHTATDLVLVEPDATALAAFAPQVRVANYNAPLGGPVDPACRLLAARLAGSADEGGVTFRGPRKMVGCYPVDRAPAVVRYVHAGQTITILGSGLPLTNGSLAQEGNAALALNLLNGHRSIIWLTPQLTAASIRPPATSNGRSGPPLIPGAAWLVVLQLGVAVVLAALWRARRFGPLISERLPVVVRASETVEGHARLYQSRHARDQAAAALRDDMLGRVQPTLGLVSGTPKDAVIDSLAARSGRGRHEVAAIVYGPPPATDAELVRLAEDLNELEREVRAQ